MKRKQLFEFEDQSWFPDPMRISLTRLIIVLHRLLGLKQLVATVLMDALRKANQRTVVDLGAGAGGSMPEILRDLQSHKEFEDTEMLLTDLYPGPEVVQEINARKQKGLRYHPQPVDATMLNNAPKGLKTMMNSFHHLPPDNAQKILQSAAESKQALLIYEMAENKIPFLVWLLFLPVGFSILAIMVFFMTPFVKPLTFKQLFFTYIIPVIPLFYAWDGQASLPRIYSFSDLKTMTAAAQSDGYRWELSTAKKKNGKQIGYYLLGIPESHT